MSGGYSSEDSSRGRGRTPRLAANTRPEAEVRDSHERVTGEMLRPQVSRLSETRRREANKARLATVPRAEATNIDLRPERRSSQVSRSEVSSLMRPRMVADRYGGWASEDKRLGPGQTSQLEDKLLEKTSPKIFTT